MDGGLLFAEYRSTVTETFVHEFVSRFGVPQKLHTDQGTQFQSRVMKEICKILGIHKTRTTPFHLMSEGLVERFNRTLESMLSLYVKTNQRDWDKFVSLITMAYRSTPQESTQVPSRVNTSKPKHVDAKLTYQVI